MADINGTPNQDILEGTSNGDHISGGDGNDSLAGLGGDDEIDGDNDHDYLSGGDGNDVLRGGEGDDGLTGDPGQDRLFGGDGNDFLGSGYSQSDEMYGEAGEDSLFYSASQSSEAFAALLDGGTGDDWFLIQAPQEQTVDVAVLGGSGYDHIISRGGSAVDIDAGTEADLVEITVYRTEYEITVGSGADLLVVDSNQFHPSDAGGLVVTDFASGDNGDALVLIPYLARQLVSWDFADNPFTAGYLRVVQVGDDAVIEIDRDAGGTDHAFAEFLVLEGVLPITLTARNLGGYSRFDAATPGVTVEGGVTPDFVNGTSGDDLISGFAGDDALFGGAGADQLHGGADDDTLDGQLGDDVVYGGGGNDTLNDALDGSDALYGELGDDRLFVDRQWFPGRPNTESLLDGGDGNDQLIFMGPPQLHDATLVGGSGNDSISAYLGRNITIDAGDGNDFVNLDMGIGNSLVTLGAGSDTVQLSMYLPPVVAFTITDFAAGNGGDAFYLAPILQRLVEGWDYTDPTNPFSDNLLRVARSGADTLLLYNVDGEGTDYEIAGRLLGVNASQLTAFNFGYDIGAVAVAGSNAAETVVGTSSSETLLGFGGNDTLLGGSGNDVLDGGTGADWHEGGLGDDSYIADNTGDVVHERAGGGADTVYSSVKFSLGKNVENLTLTGDSSITGSGNDLDNVIIGNAANNLLKGGLGADTLIGGDGDDTLRGGPGSDSMNGGRGNDLYSVEDVGDRVNEAAGEGTDTVHSLFTFSLGANVENLLLLGTGAFNGSGNALDNVITGNAGANLLKGGAGSDTLRGAAGDDVLNGGIGADVMDGGDGDDFYYVDDAADLVYDSAGLDTIQSSVGVSLGTTIESLMLTGSANINGSGNGLNNYLTGNAGANTLKGGGGKDLLAGGLGADTLDGGAGADKFLFDSAIGGTNLDRIVDFWSADDTIYLDQSIFAALGTGVLASGAFRSGATAIDADDRILFDGASGKIRYDADGSGLIAAVTFALVEPGTALGSNDFFVTP